MNSSKSLGRGARIGAALFSVVFGIGLGLILGEVVARRRESGAEGHAEPLPLFAKNRPRNELGFRDYDYPLRKPDGHFRIVVLGDSFTSAENVAFDDSYAKRLERALNHFSSAESHPVFEVWNAGRAGISTPQEVGILEFLLRRHVAPDLVVVGYCLNDAEDWSKPRLVRDMRRSHHAHRWRERPQPEGFRRFLFAHSALARWVTRRLFNTETFRGQLDYFRDLYDEDQSGWQQTRHAFSRLGLLSRRHGFPVVVTIFPLFSFGLDDGYPFRAVHGKVRAAAESAGLHALDLFPTFRELDRFRLEAVPNDDPHPSEIGHRLAADSLWSYLVSNRLVPATVDAAFPRATSPLPPPYAAIPAAPERMRVRPVTR